MATINAQGSNLGSLPGVNGATSVKAELDFTAGTRATYEANGDGSAAYRQKYQSIFVDNSLNADPLKLTFMGSDLSVTVPPNSQAILPLSTPPGMLYIIGEGVTAAIKIPIVLFDVLLPFLVWGTASGGALRFGTGAAIVNAQVMIGTARQNVAGVGANYTRLRNRSNASIFLGGAAVTTANGFELAPGDVFEVGLTTRPNGAIFAVAGSENLRLDRISW